jgi:hypothetical protein
MNLSAFDLWRIRALSFADRLGYSPDRVNEALGVLSSVFSAEWLQEVTVKRTLGSPFPFREHPIGGALHAPRDMQVLDLLEVVEYLKFTAASAALPIVVDSLKAQYGSTVLQLAFAYRFARAGATYVELEPPVAGGRVGDIAFCVGEQRYIAECFIPGPSVVGDSRQEVQWLTQQALDGIADERTILSVAVQLHETLTSARRKELVRSIRSRSEQLKAGAASDAPYPEPLLECLQAGTVSVAVSTRVGPDQHSLPVLHEEFPAPSDNQADVFVRVQWADRSAAFSAQNQVLRGEYGTHIAVWFPPEERKLNSLKRELEEPLARLGKKLKQKLAQTKLGPEWQRLLVVQTWIVDEMERASEEDLRRLRRRIFEEHSGVAGILLVRRHWDDRLKRTVYLTRILLPDDQHPAFQAWIEHVCEEARTCGVP